MKKRCHNKLLISVASLLLLVNMEIAYAQKKSWDGDKAENENNIWKSKLDSWDVLNEKWDVRRASLHEQYFGDDFNGTEKREYCDVSGCWGDELLEVSFKGRQNSGENWSLRKESSDAEVAYANGNAWNVVNGGQSAEFNVTDGEFWKSRNFGQGMEYRNAQGNIWESGNFGQEVTYIGKNGESWKSENFGQSVKSVDKDGNVWFGSEGNIVEDTKIENDF